MLPEGARVSRPPQLSPARTRRGIGRGKAGGTPALPSQRAAAATASRDMASIAATSSLRTYTPRRSASSLNLLLRPITLFLGSQHKVTVPRHQPGKGMRNIDLKSMKIYFRRAPLLVWTAISFTVSLKSTLQMREMETTTHVPFQKISRLSKLYGSRGGWGRGEYRNCARCHHDGIAIRFD